MLQLAVVNFCSGIHVPEMVYIQVYPDTETLKYIGEYWNSSGVPVLPENVIFTFFRKS